MPFLGNLFKGTPSSIQTQFIKPRIGDIPITNPIPFVNPLFNIAGQNLSQFVGDDLPSGAIEIGKIGDDRLISTPFERDRISLDDSFLDVPITPRENVFGDLFNPADLAFPDIPALRDRISAPNLPTANTAIFSALEEELINPDFGTSRAEKRFLSDLLEQISGTAGLRGLNLSPEAAAETIAPDLIKFRDARLGRLSEAASLEAKVRADTIQGLVNIHGIEVAQRADDISRDINLYNIQVQKVTSLRNKKAELETQLEQSRITAASARQTLQTQLKITEINAQLDRERITLEAAITLANLGQGRTEAAIGGGRPSIFETLAPILGGIAGGPIGAAVGTLISGKFGSAPGTEPLGRPTLPSVDTTLV